MYLFNRCGSYFHQVFHHYCSIEKQAMRWMDHFKYNLEKEIRRSHTLHDPLIVLCQILKEQAQTNTMTREKESNNFALNFFVCFHSFSKHSVSCETLKRQSQTYFLSPTHSHRGPLMFSELGWSYISAVFSFSVQCGCIYYDISII